MRLFLFLLVILVVTLCLGIILCPYSMLLTEPVSDGRS